MHGEADESPPEKPSPGSGLINMAEIVQVSIFFFGKLSQPNFVQHAEASKPADHPMITRTEAALSLSLSVIWWYDTTTKFSSASLLSSFVQSGQQNQSTKAPCRGFKQKSKCIQKVA